MDILYFHPQKRLQAGLWHFNFIQLHQTVKVRGKLVSVTIVPV